MLGAAAAASAIRRSGPGLDREVDFARASGHRTVSLEEVLVGIRRVELHDLEGANAAREVLGQCLGEVGLSGSRGAVENDLALLFE